MSKSKFFYCDLSTLYEIEKMVADKDGRKDIVLNRGHGFADVVRYNRSYDTAVFLTVKEEDLKALATPLSSPTAEGFESCRYVVERQG